VELNGQQPHLAEAVNDGFKRIKSMFRRLLMTERELDRLLFLIPAFNGRHCRRERGNARDDI
jgi:hypothetical protein